MRVVIRADHAITSALKETWLELARGACRASLTTVAQQRAFSNSDEKILDSRFTRAVSEKV
jgi:hypothetical protein